MKQEYCGPKNSNRVGKHGALAFVRRTLVKCRKFEQTGTSCFDEPPFRDMFISGPSYGSNAKCIYTSAGETTNKLMPLEVVLYRVLA